MNVSFSRLITMLLAVVAVVLVSSAVEADPIVGRDVLKFAQAPMINTTFSTGEVFQGHDELSTAYGFPDAVNPVIPVYEGRFMADDFADNFNSPVVHVRWWGSYRNDFLDDSMPVDKFLISFESDAPVTADNPFSHPDEPLLNQVVRRGPLGIGSGTFTEKVIRGPDPILGESLYEYNAELHLDKPFPEKADEIYWLKIVAMVDVPAGTQFDPLMPPTAVTQWGWHNRDYTIQNPLASPNVAPGEFIEGFVENIPVWHFQDDSVSGDVRINTLTSGGLMMPEIIQTNMSPQHYIDGIDGPAGLLPGTFGIGNFSKDLAFEIYTVVPEPSTCLLLLGGCVGLALARRRACC